MMNLSISLQHSYKYRISDRNGLVLFISESGYLTIYRGNDHICDNNIKYYMYMSNMLN